MKRSRAEVEDNDEGIHRPSVRPRRSASPLFEPPTAHRSQLVDLASSALATATSSMKSVYHLALSSLNAYSRVHKVPAFQIPTQLLAFSYTPSREQVFTNEALKYFVEPPRGADLNYGYEKWIKRPEEKGRLDGLLRALLRVEAKRELGRAGVVSWRGVMTKILTAPYEERDGWELNVMRLGGTLYLEEHVSNEKIKEKENLAPRQRVQTYFGYSFESYCTSSTPDPRDDPDRDRGWAGDVDTNVQWCSVTKTKLGETRLIIGGEVDCVRGKYTGQPDTFMELKTSITIRPGNSTDEARFEKKLLKFYFQSFLLGVPEIVVGFRTPPGRLSTLQYFKTIEIPRMVRGKRNAWDPNVCLSWGQHFLEFLQNLTSHSTTSSPNTSTAETGGSSDNGNKDSVPSVGELPSNLASSPQHDGSHQPDDTQVWRVIFVPGSGIEVRLLDQAGIEDVRNGEERVGFLPKWFWQTIIGQNAEPNKQKNYV